MKIGDLVKYDGLFPTGLIMDFDKDGDPIVEFFDQDMVTAAYYTTDIEVVNESR